MPSKTTGLPVIPTSSRPRTDVSAPRSPSKRSIVGPFPTRFQGDDDSLSVIQNFEDDLGGSAQSDRRVAHLVRRQSGVARSMKTKAESKVVRKKRRAVTSRTDLQQTSRPRSPAELTSQRVTTSQQANSLAQEQECTSSRDDASRIASGPSKTSKKMHGDTNAGPSKHVEMVSGSEIHSQEASGTAQPSVQRMSLRKRILAPETPVNVSRPNAQASSPRSPSPPRQPLQIQSTITNFRATTGQSPPAAEGSSRDVSPRDDSSALQTKDFQSAAPPANSRYRDEAARNSLSSRANDDPGLWMLAQALVTEVSPLDPIASAPSPVQRAEGDRKSQLEWPRRPTSPAPFPCQSSLALTKSGSERFRECIVYCWHKESGSQSSSQLISHSQGEFQSQPLPLSSSKSPSAAVKGSLSTHDEVTARAIGFFEGMEQQPWVSVDGRALLLIDRGIDTIYRARIQPPARREVTSFCDWGQVREAGASARKRYME